VKTCRALLALLLASFCLIVSAEKGDFTLETIKVWKHFERAWFFNAHRLHRRLDRCFRRNIDDGIDMMEVSDTYWRKVVEYGGNRGAPPSDPWNEESTGFMEHDPIPLMSEEDRSKKFPLYPEGSENITIGEPCNSASNWAYHQALVELCEYDQRHLLGWAWKDEWKTGLIRAFHFMGPASLFFHSSNTRAGGFSDVESIRQIALLFLQHATDPLPYDPVIHDLQETPAARTALELIEDTNRMILNDTVDTWADTMESFETVR